ncbi:MAG TPA: HYR domain-containing protein [Gaiellaceae bacterium]|nr:HYR domain-containing protein [Gaiellaceae bacterium]
MTDADSPHGRTVEFAVSAVDWRGRSISVGCAPSSGYVFPIGTTTVTCSAADAGGRTASESFTVRVNGVPEQLAALRAAVVAAGLETKTTEKLTSQLDDVRKQLEATRTTAVCGGLSDFVDAVQRQSGKSSAAADADAFVAGAQRMRAVLSCA